MNFKKYYVEDWVEIKRDKLYSIGQLIDQLKVPTGEPIGEAIFNSVSDPTNEHEMTPMMSFLLYDINETENVVHDKLQLSADNLMAAMWKLNGLAKKDFAKAGFTTEECYFYKREVLLHLTLEERIELYGYEYVDVEVKKGKWKKKPHLLHNFHSSFFKYTFRPHSPTSMRVIDEFDLEDKEDKNFNPGDKQNVDIYTPEEAFQLLNSFHNRLR